MTSASPLPSRLIAAKVLLHFDPYKNYASVVLDKLLDKTDHRAAATDLTFGTIRNLQAVDLVISRFSERDVKRIQPKILNVIRVAVYELIYSPQTPAYAILDTAVEITGQVAGKKQKGFVNAVLRQITRHIENRNIDLSQAPLEQTLPQNLISGCQFDTQILPDPETSPGLYLSDAFSVSKWLTENWVNEFGFETAKQICLASNRRPSIYLRPNPLKTTLQELSEKLIASQVDLEPLPDISMIKVTSPKSPQRLPGFDQGLFTVQDTTASLVVRSLPVEDHWTILDLCAAPGGKTTQLAEVTKDRAKITATDINPERLGKLKENIRRLGINSIDIAGYGSIERSDKLFDCILIDAPCSNTGVLAKRPEARFRVNPKSVNNLAKIQLGLLEKAKTMLKPNGLIAYSTCSILQEENSGLVKEFLHKNRDLAIESQALTLPCAKAPDRDGGYFAVIRPKADIIGP